MENIRDYLKNNVLLFDGAMGTYYDELTDDGIGCELANIKNVVDTVVRENVKLVGLSALMTTTLPAMKKTIEEIRKVSDDCKVWVGGAVLTKEYADEMGADFYAPDARSSVDIAKTVLG